jgi:tRNA(Ile)-lysidine synthase
MSAVNSQKRLKRKNALNPSLSVRAAEGFDLDAIFDALKNERHVAVAVSGGSDSMALLHLSYAWACERGIALTALCFDHGLRAASAEEATLVEARCIALGIACKLLKWVEDKPSTGVQAAARRARYDAMTRHCKTIGASALLTGHTQNDQAETVVMRRERTESDLSLAAIWPETAWQDVRVVRPLIDIPRDVLRDFLRVRNISWIDDPSNEDRRFERVRVRQALAEQEVSYLSGVAKDAQSRVTDAQASIENWARDLTRDFLGVVRFEAASFLALDRLGQALALRRAFVFFGAGEKVERAELEGIAGWVADGSTGRRTLGGVMFRRRLGRVEMIREVARIAPETLVHAEDAIWWDRRFWVKAPLGARIVPVAHVPGIARNRDIPAVVQDGLPCVILSDGQVCVPHLGIGELATAQI